MVTGDPALACVFGLNAASAAWTGDLTNNVTGIASADGDIGSLTCGSTSTTIRLYVQGLPTGAVVELTQDLDGTASTVSFNQNGVFRIGAAFRYQLAILRQPEPVPYGDGFADTTCLFRQATGELVADTGQRMGRFNTGLFCTFEVRAPTDAGVDAGPLMDVGVDAGPPIDVGTDAGPEPCLTGCSAVFDVPTTDGVAATGTFTVPAICNEVFIAAWGAGGGAGGRENPFPMPERTFGGAGGYVEGRLPVAAGDVSQSG